MASVVFDHLNDNVPILKTEILKFATSYFIDKGFKWELPVILTPTTDPLFPDPSEKSIEPIIIDIKPYKQKLMLMHSMLLHKQLLVSDRYDKVFILSPNIRIEKRKPDGKHLFEFTQLDFEIRDASMYDVMSLISNFMVELTDYLSKIGLIDKHEKPYRYVRHGQFKECEFEECKDVDYSNIEKPLFVVNIPREFYDYYDEKIGIWKNFDLILPRYGEVSSGGEREYKYDKIIEKIKMSGLRPENFKYYLKLAKEQKIHPSAGAGIGIERLIAFYTKAKDIKEVQPFPRIPYHRVLI